MADLYAHVCYLNVVLNIAFRMMPRCLIISRSVEIRPYRYLLLMVSTESIEYVIGFVKFDWHIWIKIFCVFHVFKAKFYLERKWGSGIRSA